MYAGVDARVGLRFKINIPQHYRSQRGPTIRYTVNKPYGRDQGILLERQCDNIQFLIVI